MIDRLRYDSPHFERLRHNRATIVWSAVCAVACLYELIGR